ncbi:potassium transporter TrkA [Phytohabitans sp. ZYX-F-186]|uniref:Potassium transporter TrkA n=1 Tax=Phytohabitans maris TaxID=3071409 RepID=A0ABU0ZTR0_9ACTN|nr:potassium transporter TrkA [Phytohabitans sp. ZYX-F-186]MDQ7910176.1 potassium transporter TrkA [Phytohabitans sp. ZYX-F-186]
MGSGSLARATCLALSTADTSAGLSVVLLARDGKAAAGICHIAGVRAALSRRPVRFTAVPVDPTDPAAVGAALAAAAPDGVLVCASTQSPWEPADRPSAWTALLRRAGFGLTLPFQAQVALAVGAALRRSHPAAFLVNAAFPDAVNPLLTACDVPVVSGVGNVAILAAALQAALGLPDQARLHVIGHHLHLHAPADPGDEALVWLDGTRLDGVTDLLAADRSTGDGRGRNDVTGLLAAELVTTLLTGATRDTHLPGVAGLPGGYPVRITAGEVALRLPPGVDRDQAVEANRRWALRDGALVEDGRVRFGPSVAGALAPLLPAYAEGFAAGEVAEATAAFQALRERLRSQPVTS